MLAAAIESQYGWTALIFAADGGHADCARLLIDAGADKEAKDSVRVSRMLNSSISSFPTAFSQA
jgi:ankyrin repeat protein